MSSSYVLPYPTTSPERYFLLSDIEQKSNMIFLTDSKSTYSTNLNKLRDELLSSNIIKKEKHKKLLLKENKLFHIGKPLVFYLTWSPNQSYEIILNNVLELLLETKTHYSNQFEDEFFDNNMKEIIEYEEDDMVHIKNVVVKKKKENKTEKKNIDDEDELNEEVLDYLPFNELKITIIIDILLDEKNGNKITNDNFKTWTSFPPSNDDLKKNYSHLMEDLTNNLSLILSSSSSSNDDDGNTNKTDNNKPLIVFSFTDNDGSMPGIEFLYDKLNGILPGYYNESYNIVNLITLNTVVLLGHNPNIEPDAFENVYQCLLINDKNIEENNFNINNKYIKQLLLNKKKLVNEAKNNANKFIIFLFSILIIIISIFYYKK